ncbi:hypothetical protein, partial [Planktothrix sp. FACHB-1355]|uniref:hypothetical protein n=1 Tax=Planktothrix sp. FACHB-1355 TaxID=2692854 RepID=UPI001A7E74AC
RFADRKSILNFHETCVQPKGQELKGVTKQNLVSEFVREYLEVGFRSAQPNLQIHQLNRSP